jgi:hypothetical protein
MGLEDLGFSGHLVKLPVIKKNSNKSISNIRLKTSLNCMGLEGLRFRV